MTYKEALLGGVGGWCTVISYPCKSGVIYPLSLKVPTLLSLKVLLAQLSLIPKTPTGPQLPLIPQIICPVIPYP